MKQKSKMIKLVGFAVTIIGVGVNLVSDWLDERAVYTAQYCLEQLLRKTSNWRGYSLKQESYSRWAIKEILIRLEENQDTPPLIIIEEFRDQMDKYSCLNQFTSHQFSCAKDMAEWVIDLLIS